MGEPQFIRQFFQIYTEMEAPWDAKERTESRFRAMLLNTLAQHGFREFIPARKNVYGFTEDVVRLSNPEAEVKYGITCKHVYVQVSVSDFSKLTDLNAEVVNAIWKFFNPKVT